MSIHIQSLLNNKSWNQCRLDAYYKQIIIQDYLLKQNIKNLLEIPKITKINLHFTSSAIVNDKKFLVNALVALHLLSGRKPLVLLAKKSVAAFKVRKKQLIGCKITLRKNCMFFFLDNFINVVIPRLADLEINKISKKIISSRITESEHSFGMKQLLLFPQLENQFQFFESLKGLDIIVSTSCLTNKTNQANLNKNSLSILLSGFQIPILTGSPVA